jgi:hypothetical protein
MDLTLVIIKHIRSAKKAEPQTRLSDFQFRVVNDCPILVNLSNGYVRLLLDADRDFREGAVI